jgi:adenine/guanine phosphoribosyltransferase-like PRPP-binding protein
MPHAASMPKKRKVVVVDLFCGAGGTSEGLKEAIEVGNAVPKNMAKALGWAALAVL